MRSAVAAMKPYVPGRSLESVQRELGLHKLAKMNQNENPLGPSPAAVKAIAATLEDLHIYPEGSAPTLRDHLADHWQLPPDWFLIGNGSGEVFRLLAEVYLERGDAVVVPTPSFGGYPLVAEPMGAHVVRVPLVDDAIDLPAMARTARDRGPLWSSCAALTAHGYPFDQKALRSVMSDFPAETLVILDEAYREYDESDFDARGLLLDYPNLIVTRTFSKMYGLAGLRVGYGIMRPEVLSPLMRLREPFSVNVAAIAAGIAALGDREHVERTLQMVREGKEYFYREFERLGLAYVRTEANFILFHTPKPAVDVYEDLLHAGVLIRPCTSFGLPYSLRVTIGTAEENRALIEALERI